MDLVLTGGGSGKDTEEIDKLFASKLNKDKPLLYIPIAIDNIKRPYSECLKWLRSTFDNLGVKEYKMWTEYEINNMETQPSPSKFSGIYIGGGNTPYLLNKVKNTFLKNFLKKAIDENVPIYGGSAGALIFSKTIVSSLKYDKNWVEIEDIRGLNMVGGYEITCHYSQKERTKIRDLISKYNVKNLIALTEKSGIHINNEGMFLIGKEKGIVFYGEVEKEILVNSKISRIE